MQLLSVFILSVYLTMASSRTYPLERPNHLITKGKYVDDVPVIQDQKGSETFKERAAMDTMKTSIKTERSVHEDLKRSHDNILSDVLSFGMAAFEFNKNVKLAVLKLLASKIDVLTNNVQNSDVFDLMDSPFFKLFMNILGPLSSKSSDSILFPESQ